MSGIVYRKMASAASSIFNKLDEVSVDKNNVDLHTWLKNIGRCCLNAHEIDNLVKGQLLMLIECLI